MTVGDEKPCFHSREGPKQSQGRNDSDDNIHDALPLHSYTPYVAGKKACAICRPGVSERPAAPARPIIHRNILLAHYYTILCNSVQVKTRRDSDPGSLRAA